MRTHSLRAVGMALFAFAIAAAHAAAQPTFTRIPLLTRVYALSADGNTAVGAVANPTSYAARWDRGIGSQYLTVVSGTTASIAWNITPDGQTIIGNIVVNGLPNQRAARWDKGFPLFLDGGDNAYGITADGQTIVGSRLLAGPQTAMRWNASGVPIPLAPMPDGTTARDATAISHDGRVIAGTAPTPGNMLEACAWIDDVPMTLGVLGGDELRMSVAWAVSADGSTIIGFSTNGPRSVCGFRWTLETGMQPLPATTNNAWAWAVNGDGSMIVGNDGGVATIWTPQTGTVPLQSWLLSEYGLDLPDWTLTDATAITPDGMHIAGFGHGPGGTSAWIVTLPSPGTSLPLGLAILAIARRRRMTDRRL